MSAVETAALAAANIRQVQPPDDQSTDRIPEVSAILFEAPPHGNLVLHVFAWNTLQ